MLNVSSDARSCHTLSLCQHYKIDNSLAYGACSCTIYNRWTQAYIDHTKMSNYKCIACSHTKIHRTLRGSTSRGASGMTPDSQISNDMTNSLCKALMHAAHIVHNFLRYCLVGQSYFHPFSLSPPRDWRSACNARSRHNAACTYACAYTE